MTTSNDEWNPTAYTENSADDANDYLKYVPQDKELSTSLIAELLERGEPERFSKPEELRNIGMPVGGFFAGTVYVGGDGRLWVWDVFNVPGEGTHPRLVEYKGVDIVNRAGGNYIEPAQPYDQPDIGFGLALDEGGFHPFRLGGFSDIEFQGQYPIAQISYADAAVPLKVKLEAFSPFIPLSVDDSSLPLTVQKFTLHNPTDKTVSGQVLGWIENPVGAQLKEEEGVRKNRIVNTEGFTGIECGASAPAAEQRHIGTMLLAFLQGGGFATAHGDERGTVSAGATVAEGNLRACLRGQVAIPFSIEPGETKEITGCVAWHFANLRLLHMPKVTGHYYAQRFMSALAVVEYFAKEESRLVEATFRWRDTWYDSTLPYWFLNRTMANTSTLATSTCYRLDDGRFWCWEGVGACEGTCTHVWHYAQAVARLFPELERNLRERTDFDSGFDPETGMVGIRGECYMRPAADGQAAIILRAYREHLLSSDDGFLQCNYQRIRQAMQYLMGMDAEDGVLNGMIEGRQHNTLDADWYGKIPAIASLYLCALTAMARMAKRMNDDEFATECERLFALGRPLYEGLFNGEYFIQEINPAHAEAIGTGAGCYIDQVIGVWWANQLGLPALFDEEKVHSALQSLWRYNYVPNIGAFREHFTEGRWYAMEEDAGLLMCTWPKGGFNPAWKNNWQFMYFNECMSGFEWQVAGHFLAEGMITEGIGLSHAIHQRYRAKRRNPYNEIECSDHYARAMASYGAFLAATGYEYDGPEGVLGFAPAWGVEKFKTAFTTAEGWGTFEQIIEDNVVVANVVIRRGNLSLRVLRLGNFKDRLPNQVRVVHGENDLAASLQTENRAVICLEESVVLREGDSLRIVLKNR